MPPCRHPARFDVLGVHVSALDLDLAAAVCLDAIATNRRGYICVSGVHGVMESQADPGLRDIHNRSFLTTPDGMPLVWLGRLAGFSTMDRVYGPDLMLALCDRGRAADVGHFFYGGAPGVAGELADEMARRFPGIRICGCGCPPFRPLDENEMTALAADIRRANPSIIWIGLSTPKQERFMADFVNRLDSGLLFGVGAAFDFHTGRIQQAPRWMQRSGLEWFYRLMREPKRLWKRYLLGNTRFLAALAWNLVRGRPLSAKVP